ncbi:CGNR zinc finger domain-containing protein [Stackebrandtia nassauensis]|nr:CGNR zinc finger domain-containing protein [Stackebrandtia nassauensis]
MVEPSAATAFIRDFANTVDVEDRTDKLATRAGLDTWLRDNGLPTGEASEPILTLRAGLRERLLLNNNGDADTDLIAAAEHVLRGVPLYARLGTDPVPDDPLLAETALARVARDWAVTVASGEWIRLKQCPDHACLWVFWDGSRSRTRRWCTMRVCGNRAKTRAYTARHREPAQADLSLAKAA